MLWNAGRAISSQRSIRCRECFHYFTIILFHNIMQSSLSRFYIQNSSHVSSPSESQLPVQTYSLKLQNNKPVKLFVRVRNDTNNNHELAAKTLDFVQKISHVFVRCRREVLQQCKEMMIGEEEYNCHGPSLLEEMMKSQIPLRNGSFIHSGGTFSLIKSSKELNRRRSSRCSGRRDTISSLTKLMIPGLIKITDFVCARARKQERMTFDILKQSNRVSLKEVMSRVIGKIASHSLLDLETSILRLKKISSSRTKSQRQIQQGQSNQKQMPQEAALLPKETDEASQNLLLKEFWAKQQTKRMQCFITILQNLDRAKTFGSINSAFLELRVK